MRLVYMAEGVRFAKRAVEALRAAGIPCMRGGEQPDLDDGTGLGPGRLGYPEIGIYVVEESDYGRPSQILLKMGAAREKPVSPLVAWFLDRLAWGQAIVTAIVLVLALWPKH